MAQQITFLPSSLLDTSNSTNLLNHSLTSWENRLPAGQDMLRHLSSDSAYYSTVSQNSDERYSPRPSPTAMSYGAASPSVYEEENCSMQRYSNSPYLPSSSDLQCSNSFQTNSSRATPSSLGLEDDSLLKAYKFVVQKSKEPYFELQSTSYVSPDLPVRIYLDSPSNLQKNTFPCQYPGCPSRDQIKPFKRPADLERHYRNVHADLDQKDQFLCDYEPCQKNRAPFTRKDHFRDHLRDYHKEDLGCAKGEKIYEREKWLKCQEAWIGERKIVATWWRCSKCLHRIQIVKSGWECQDCKTTCDKERVERIDAVRAKVVPDTTSTPSGMDDRFETPATSYPTNCAACSDTAWIWNINDSRWDACPTCQPSVEQFYKTGDDWPAVW